MAKDQPRHRQAPLTTASQQLEALLGHPWPFTGRPPVHDLARRHVIDDWPDPVPVTEAEDALFERWFANLIDEIATQGE